MVISEEVLSVNVGGTHKNSTLQEHSDVVASEAASATDYQTNYLLVSKSTSNIVSPLVAETSTCAWLKEEEKWILKCSVIPNNTKGDNNNNSYDGENRSKVMSRESRHVHVSGLPDVTEERVAGFFGT